MPARKSTGLRVWLRLPTADPGYVLLIDNDGTFLTDDDGAYLQERA